MNGNVVSGLGINCGKGIVIDIDVKKFTEEVDNYIYRYGLKQCLADTHSAIKQKLYPDDYKQKSRALVEKKLKALYAGEFRANSERGERLDAVEYEARALCLKAINKKIMEQGKKLSSFTSDQFKAQVDKHFTKYMVEAEKIVAIRLEAAKKPAEKDDDDLIAGM